MRQHKQINAERENNEPVRSADLVYAPGQKLPGQPQDAEIGKVGIKDDSKFGGNPDEFFEPCAGHVKKRGDWRRRLKHVDVATLAVEHARAHIDQPADIRRCAAKAKTKGQEGNAGEREEKPHVIRQRENARQTDCPSEGGGGHQRFLHWRSRAETRGRNGRCKFELTKGRLSQR
ncbi:MAG: hypothetical protein RIE56_06705 [Amphiplicatus sp.]